MTTERTALSKRTRFDIFKRDEFTCSYCGQKPPAVVLEIDHIVPVSGGGGDNKENLTTSCFDCNRGKAGVPLGFMPQAVVDKRGELAEREQQERAYIRFVKSRRKRQDKLMIEVAHMLFGESYTFKPKAAHSCRYFLERLPFDTVLFAAGEAASKADGSFEYFCAICWRSIRAAAGSPK